MIEYEPSAPVKAVRPAMATTAPRTIAPDTAVQTRALTGSDAGQQKQRAQNSQTPLLPRDPELILNFMRPIQAPGSAPEDITASARVGGSMQHALADLDYNGR